MDYGMTNREKRARLDKEFSRGYRNCDEAGVVASREAYLEKHYGKLLHRDLPLPQHRENWNRPLTMKVLQRVLLENNDRRHTIADNIGLSILFLLFGAFMLVIVIKSPGNSGLVFLVGLGAIMLGGMGLKSIPQTLREKKENQTNIQQGKFEIRGYRVLDMSHQDESSATDDNADWRYYLHLEKPGQKEPWYCSCSADDYSRFREEDIVYIVTLPGRQEHFFLFREEDWVPDAQIRAYMRRPL